MAAFMTGKSHLRIHQGIDALAEKLKSLMTYQSMRLKAQLSQSKSYLLGKDVNSIFGSQNLWHIMHFSNFNWLIIFYVSS